MVKRFSGKCAAEIVSRRAFKVEKLSELEN